MRLKRLAGLCGLSACFAIGLRAQPCGEWLPDLPGSSSLLGAVTTWDPDGAGPLGTQLVVAGWYPTGMFNVFAYRVERWDGVAWTQIGTDFSNSVVALATWDSDGPGPLAAELIAAGNFEIAGAQGVARWDGAAWQPMSGGFNGGGRCIATWDSDGAAATAEVLVVGGNFYQAGDGVTALNQVAVWNGADWQHLGMGLEGGGIREAKALTTWDPDGAGPLHEELVVGGSFDGAGGVDSHFVAAWGASGWHGFDGGMSGGLTGLTTWDPDGDGPLSRVLVASGGFSMAGGMPVSSHGIAYWDGAWHGLGDADPNGTLFGVWTWDPDGPGGAPEQLVATGGMTQWGPTLVGHIARWSGTAWGPFGVGGMGGTVWGTTGWDPDGAGPAPTYLAATGHFATAGGHAAQNWDLWTEGEAPVIADHPAGANAGCGDDVMFTITLAGGDTGVAYQWRKDGADLSDGPTGSGSTIMGATSDALTIENVSAADAGAYDCIASNACDSVMSHSPELSVSDCGLADCNSNGVADGEDVAEGTSSDCDGNSRPDECDPDGDGDGAIDVCDGCPNDTEKMAPGACGCGVADDDTDSDGTPDCDDDCPDDPDKVHGGQCGCGMPDTDSDSDGEADCDDGCPADADKTDAGECGCGTPDNDSDSDGTADCADACPHDEDKTDPGACGCGAADADADGNGTADCLDSGPGPGENPGCGNAGCGVGMPLLAPALLIGWPRRRHRARQRRPGRVGSTNGRRRGAPAA